MIANTESSKWEEISMCPQGEKQAILYAGGMPNGKIVIRLARGRPTLTLLRLPP